MKISGNVMDIVERAGWTGAQAAVALTATDLGGVSAWWAAPLALLLSAIKTYLIGRASAAKTPSTQKAQAGD